MLPTLKQNNAPTFYCHPQSEKTQLKPKPPVKYSPWVNWFTCNSFILPLNSPNKWSRLFNILWTTKIVYVEEALVHRRRKWNVRFFTKFTRCSKMKDLTYIFSFLFRSGFFNLQHFGIQELWGALLPLFETLQQRSAKWLFGASPEMGQWPVYMRQCPVYMSCVHRSTEVQFIYNLCTEERETERERQRER